MNEKIMVVDDDKDIREVIQVLLSSEGYEVIEQVMEKKHSN